MTIPRAEAAAVVAEMVANGETDGTIGPVPPGRVLREDFMEPLGLSNAQLAADLGVSTSRISELLNGLRGFTPDTAKRLAKRFGTTPEFWLDLQKAHEEELRGGAPPPRPFGKIR